jgi:hypothetical protein
VDEPIGRQPLKVLRHRIDLIVVTRKREAQPLVYEIGRPRLVCLYQNAALDKKVQMRLEPFLLAAPARRPELGAVTPLK